MAIPLDKYKITPEQSQQKLQEISLERYKLNQQKIAQSEPLFSVGKALGNIPSSAMGVVSGIAGALTHPIQTITGLGRIGAGAIQSIPGIGGAYTKRTTETGKTAMLEENRQAFQNVKEFFVNRYGTPQKAIKSLEQDPVGVALDVSILLSGTGTLLKSAKLGKLAAITEPVTAGAKVTKAILKPPIKGLGILGREALGVTTGAGGETLRVAYQSAKTGGGKFIQALRGQISQQDVLNSAKEGLQTIKSQRAEAYKSQLTGIQATTGKVLSLEPLKTNINSLLSHYNIKSSKVGKLDFSKSTIADTAEQKRISSVVEETMKWSDNTPVGIDILKRRLDDFFTTSGQGRALTNAIRNGVNNLLNKEVPGYAEMTKGYRDASQLISELERTLSLKGTSAVDTTLKKLTSALKRDADFRRELLTKLDDATKADVAGQIAGAILNPVVPSGLIGRSVFASGPVAALFSGSVNPSMFTSIALSSPRIVGEFLNALGITARYAENIQKFLSKIKAVETARNIERPLFQAGRLKENQ